MNHLQNHIAELAMVRAIPLTADELPKGRIRALLSRLEKISQKELNDLPEIPKREYELIIDRVARWGELTWGKKKVHAVSMISFALGMVENSKFQYSARLIETMVDIIDYYDRVGKAPGICMYSGSVAAEKWQMVMEDE